MRTNYRDALYELVAMALLVAVAMFVLTAAVLDLLGVSPW